MRWLSALRQAAPAGASPAGVQLKFFVSRTRTDHLPVYTEFKSGGTRRQTVVRRIDGSAQALYDMLRHDLGVTGHVNAVTNSVVLKGHELSGPVKAWLAAKGF